VITTSEITQLVSLSFVGECTVSPLVKTPAMNLFSISAISLQSAVTPPPSLLNGPIPVLALIFDLTYCRSMCEIDLPLSGRKNDKRLFAHGNPLYFLNIICTHWPCTSASHFASVQRPEAI
jgi:hypothetical protein